MNLLYQFFIACVPAIISGEENKTSKLKVTFSVDRKVYSLTELGKSLKTILTAYRPEILN